MLLGNFSLQIPCWYLLLYKKIITVPKDNLAEL